jgi:hypothetical protein
MAILANGSGEAYKTQDAYHRHVLTKMYTKLDAFVIRSIHFCQNAIHAR